MRGTVIYVGLYLGVTSGLSSDLGDCPGRSEEVVLSKRLASFFGFRCAMSVAIPACVYFFFCHFSVSFQFVGFCWFWCPRFLGDGVFLTFLCVLLTVCVSFDYLFW